MARLLPIVLLMATSLLWWFASSDESIYKILIGVSTFLSGLILLVREIRRRRDSKEADKHHRE